MSSESLQSNHEVDEGEILFIDKSLDWTSFDVVKKIRSLYNIRKVGHAGTLDPKATGLLIVCTGARTKEINNFVGLEKQYTGTMMLGVRTPSFDTETAVSETRDCSAVADHQIKETAKSFLGKQFQIPPMYSAVKYGGKPLYRYARSGRTVEREEREIEIQNFDIVDVQVPRVDFSITCSKGTYIRSLIDDFGSRLGCGAMVSALRRVRIGEYSVSNAKTIQQLSEWRKVHSKNNQGEYEAGSVH